MQKQRGDWMKVFPLATEFVAIGEKGSTLNLASLIILPLVRISTRLAPPLQRNVTFATFLFVGSGSKGAVLPCLSRHNILTGCQIYLT
jgi:hypothetical protein